MSYIDIWRKKNSQFSNTKQQTIQQMTENYEEYLANAPNSLEYEDYYNPEVKGLLTLLDEADGSGSVDKKVITISRDSKLRVGDSIKIKSDHFHTKCWLLYKEEQLAVNSHRKFGIYSCNQTINFKGLPQPIWCVADDTAYFTKGSIEGDKFIENDDKLKIDLPRNEYTEKIYSGMRFIFEHETCYEVTSEKRVVKKGLITLTLIRTSTQPEDDKINNIAFNPKLEEITPSTTPTFIEIQGEKSIKLNQEYEFKLTKDVQWNIDDTNIAEIVRVEDDKCYVIGKKIGFFDLIAQDSEKITKTISVRR